MKKLQVLYKEITPSVSKILDTLPQVLKQWELHPTPLKALEQKHYSNPPDAYLVLGGDGTILYALYLIYKNKAPTVSINTGKIGFLATLTLETWQESIEELLSHGKVEYAPLLHGNVNELSTYAFNEIAITRNGIARNICIQCYAENTLLYNIQGDGIIVATPYGSSAYAYSAGGSLVHPKLDAYIITPILPSRVHIPPLVLPQNTPLSFRIAGDISLTFDGQRTLPTPHNTTTITITCIKEAIPLIHPCSNYYFDHLHTKGIIPSQ